MKISKTECAKAAAARPAADERILPMERPRKRVERSAAEKATLTPLEQGMLTAEEALKGVPDVREEIVGELRQKIEKGEYKVSGEEIAEMMIRRLRADRVR